MHAKTARNPLPRMAIRWIVDSSIRQLAIAGVLAVPVVIGLLIWLLLR
jgi:hypothetical protein